MILGTGLSGLADVIDVSHELAYTDIPGFPQLTVQSHQGTLMLGSLAGTPIIALNGRAHLYEGYDARQVVFGTRTGCSGNQDLDRVQCMRWYETGAQGR